VRAGLRCTLELGGILVGILVHFSDSSFSVPSNMTFAASSLFTGTSAVTCYGQLLGTKNGLKRWEHVQKNGDSLLAGLHFGLFLCTMH